MRKSSDDEFDATQHLGNRINAVARAEEIVADDIRMPSDIASRMDALIDRLTGDDN